MSPGHLVRRAGEAAYSAPVDGFARWPVVGEHAGAVHTGFGLCRLEPGGSVPTHLHSYEESVYVVGGSVVLQTGDGATRLGPGDYGVIPVGVVHSWRNESSEPARWADMLAPAPRSRYDDDTVLVTQLPQATAEPVDVRDPRNRRFGNITAAHMDVEKQGQDQLAVTASMRTALLVYGGITVKMMVDSDLGARLSTMFMVEYAPDGGTGPHDHPFEETYYFLEGSALATFDGEEYELGAGDVAWAGVGCMHSFRNLGRGRLAWLETQAPQPPGRHSYRFVRDWDYLRDAIRKET
ncbi:MAG: cupin domain-containing protein [Kribbellaceae bacterium]